MIKNILITFFILLVLLLAFRDFVIKQVIVSVGSSAMGAPVSVGGFSLSLLTHQMHMDNVRLYNPDGFTQEPLIDIARINVNYDAAALLQGKMYFSLIDLNVRQLSIERNKKGVFNAAALKINFPKSSNKPLDMKIDILKLNIDHVVFRDETKGGQVKEMNQGLDLHNRTFQNITSPQQLVALVLFDSSGIGALKNLALSTTKEVIDDFGHVTNGVTGTAGKTVGSLVDSLKTIINK